MLPLGLPAVQRHQPRTGLRVARRHPSLFHDLGGGRRRDWYERNLPAGPDAAPLWTQPRRVFDSFFVSLGEGVLLCRGNRLLTGSNTRWLRLWEVGAVSGAKPGDDACGASERSGAPSLRLLCCVSRKTAVSGLAEIHLLWSRRLRRALCVICQSHFACRDYAS